MYLVMATTVSCLEGGGKMVSNDSPTWNLRKVRISGKDAEHRKQGV